MWSCKAMHHTSGEALAADGNCLAGQVSGVRLESGRSGISPRFPLLGHYHWLGTLAVTLLGTWRCRVSPKTGWHGCPCTVGERASGICNFCPSVAAPQIAVGDPSVRYGAIGLGVRALWLGDRASGICNSCVSVVAPQIAAADPSLRYTLHVAGTVSGRESRNSRPETGRPGAAGRGFPPLPVVDVSSGLLRHLVAISAGPHRKQTKPVTRLT